MEAILPTPQSITTTPNRAIWTGRILGALVVSSLLLDTYFKLVHHPQAVAATGRLGYATHMLDVIAAIQLAFVALYVLPRTRVLGAILLTGFLGGATASHLRIGDPFWFPIAFATLAWVSLFLREPRLRALVPVSRDARTP